MDKDFEIACIALFYTAAVCVAWITKCDAVQRVKEQEKQNKVVNAYPWIIWALTTALAITAIID